MGTALPVGKCAANARKRNKDTLANLQEQVHILAADKNNLQRENDILKAQLEVLESQNRALLMSRGTVTSAGSIPHPLPPPPPVAPAPGPTVAAAPAHHPLANPPISMASIFEQLAATPGPSASSEVPVHNPQPLPSHHQPQQPPAMALLIEQLSSSAAAPAMGHPPSNSTHQSPPPPAGTHHNIQQHPPYHQRPIRHEDDDKDKDKPFYMKE